MRMRYQSSLTPPIGLVTQSRISWITALRLAARLKTMTEKLPIQRVEVRFVSAPPGQRMEGASGVSEVQNYGSVLRCLVCGSFQPFLEALRGHEVISLASMPANYSTVEGGH